MSDFPYEVLQETAHRPWPMPDAPWVMTQTWHHLLFAHWPVDARALRERLPAGLPLDLYDGQAWIGVVPFHMTNVAPRGVPNIPFVSAFPELNVRTYVTIAGKPGVYFFSLDAASAVAVAAARTLFGLPYYAATMSVDVDGEAVRYSSARETKTPGVAEFRAQYRPAGPVHGPADGSLEYFLTERYCLYRVDDSFHTHRLEIHHPRWPLQPAEAQIERNTMAEAAGIRLPSTAPLLHYSRRQDMVAWLPERL
ncbi:MAG TPA: DUF2071 domain-containing protein [Vicinamibacterales bacterium]|nr:DUF2071 domain-containing protein [Vicinamibacterales bacterium]